MAFAKWRVASSGARWVGTDLTWDARTERAEQASILQSADTTTAHGGLLPRAAMTLGRTRTARVWGWESRTRSYIHTHNEHPPREDPCAVCNRRAFAMRRQVLYCTEYIHRDCRAAGPRGACDRHGIHTTDAIDLARGCDVAIAYYSMRRS